MKKNATKIFIQDWLDFKPYNTPFASDYYYLKLCNEIKNTIINSKETTIVQLSLNSDEIKQLSCFLVSYFEDLISETNIWNTFSQYHKRLYNKYLPFYSSENYFPGEINIQDVSFLIWYFMNSIQNENFITPYNNFIYETAFKIMETFDDAWEYAPENESLTSFYTIDENETDYYVARNFIDTILFKTYLFYPDTYVKLKKSELEILDENQNDPNLVAFLNENRDYILNTSHTRLMGLKGKEWASKILPEKYQIKEDFINISNRISGFFFYKGQDENYIFIEHIATGKKFNLTKKSFEFSGSLTELDTIMYLGIVLWQDEWWFSGVFTQMDFDPDLVLDEKNSVESRMAISFLDLENNKKLDEILKKQLEAFKKVNKGSQIAFMESSEVNNFVKKYFEQYNKLLNTSKKESEDAKQRAMDEGFFGTHDMSSNLDEISEIALVFFNPISGIEIALDIINAFPAPNNPFFDGENSAGDIIHLLINQNYSKELVEYCIEKFKPILPFFNEGPGVQYLIDMDFLLRFWKREEYFSKPLITFTGRNISKL